VSPSSLARRGGRLMRIASNRDHGDEATEGRARDRQRAKVGASRAVAARCHSSREGRPRAPISPATTECAVWRASCDGNRAGRVLQRGTPWRRCRRGAQYRVSTGAPSCDARGAARPEAGPRPTPGSESTATETHGTAGERGYRAARRQQPSRAVVTIVFADLIGDRAARATRREPARA
jgi:hypothetical protein